MENALSALQQTVQASGSESYSGARDFDSGPVFTRMGRCVRLWLQGLREGEFTEPASSVSTVVEWAEGSQELSFAAIAGCRAQTFCTYVPISCTQQVAG